MNKLLILIPLSFISLAVVPLASAQLDTSSITDGLSNIGASLSGYFGQAQQFISEQPVATGVIGTTGGIASIAGIGWKVASSAKSKLQSAYNGLKGQFDDVQGKASAATEQLTAYQKQAETQLSTIQTEAQKQIEAAKTQASSATGQLGSLQTQIETLAQQKASYQNQVAELTARLKTATDQLEVLTPKIK